MPRLPTDNPRTFIADAALRQIAAHGIAALTVASLARALAITPGALYRHFASRDAILIAVAARARQLLSQDLTLDIDDPLERLDAFIQARTGTAGQHAGVVCLMTSEQLAKAIPPAARAHLRAAIGATRQFFVQILVEGQGRGQIRSDLPVEDLTIMVMGTMQLLALSASGWGAGIPPKRAASIRSSLRVMLTPPDESMRANLPPDPSSA